MKKIVIVGGGLLGAETARRFAVLAMEVEHVGRIAQEPVQPIAPELAVFEPAKSHLFEPPIYRGYMKFRGRK